MNTVLITGGAGYIGSATAKLLANDYDVITCDKEFRDHDYGRHTCLNLTSYGAVKELFDFENIWGVIHLAAYPYVAESFKDPMAYIYNNVFSFINVLKCFYEHGYLGGSFVFASSCTAKNMNSPYALSKGICEEMLPNRYNFISLRYFNVAGAWEDIGEQHPDKGRLIYDCIRRDEITVNGYGYSTPDGTPIRDYVHVYDVAMANKMAMEGIYGGVREVGTSQPNSVLDVIKAVNKVKPVKIVNGKSRIGDCGELVADSVNWLPGWKPTKTLDDIIKTQYEWSKK